MNSFCEKPTSSLAEHHQHFEPPPVPRQQHALICVTFFGLVILTSWLLLYRQQLVDYCYPPAKTIHFSLDINSAPPSELSLLPGIGTTMAERIIETRGKHGPFKSIDDIVSVPGIGNITLQEIRPFIRPISNLSTGK
jgi:competence ComEA-like helix-hairpin-helix protein